MAKESKSDKKPAVKKTTTKSASAKKTTTKSTTKSASAAKASTPKRTRAVSKTTTKTASAKKTTTKKPVQKSVPGGAPPMVDTNFAAEAAARMLATRAKLAKATGNTSHSDAAVASETSEAHHESGLFKQMKESINKPAAGGISSAMGNTFGPNKTNLPNPDKGHVVRDQTTSNVNRVNVPRRTGG
jgi:hypothetical protein